MGVHTTPCTKYLILLKICIFFKFTVSFIVTKSKGVSGAATGGVLGLKPPPEE